MQLPLGMAHEKKQEKKKQKIISTRMVENVDSKPLVPSMMDRFIEDIRSIQKRKKNLSRK
jgi:hypothetical protein